MPQAGQIINLCYRDLFIYISEVLILFNCFSPALRAFNNEGMLIKTSLHYVLSHQYSG